METIHFCPNCGSEKFRGSQEVTIDVIVDSDGNWIENDKGGVTDSDNPFGPFTCINCGDEYDDLPIQVDESMVSKMIEKKSDFTKKEIIDTFDTEVHEIFADKASKINNEGINGQISFLVKEKGIKYVLDMIVSMRSEE